MSNRNNYIDINRALAVCGVVLVHSSQASFVSKSSLAQTGILDVFALGRFGVELFFVLSAYLMTSLYSTKLDSPRALFAFGIRRLFRIWPLWALYSCAWILLFGGGLAIGLFESLPVLALALSFSLWVFPETFQYIVPGAWSIWSEVGFYLIFPLILRMGIKNWLLIVSSINIAAAILSINFSATDPNAAGAFLRLTLQSSFNFFTIGMLIAQAARASSEGMILGQIRRLGLPAILWLLTVPATPSIFGGTLEAVGVILFASAFAILVYHGPQLTSRFLSWIGKLSFGVFFSHFVVIKLLTPYFSIISGVLVTDGVFFSLLFFFIFFITIMSLSIIVAQFTWLVIEKPMQSLARQLTRD